MRTSEWLVVGYLAYIFVLAGTQSLTARQRAIVTAVVLVDGACVWWLSHARGGVGLVVRDWLPAVQILIGYWLSGAFFVGPMPRVEAWLADGDRVLFDRLGARRFIKGAPRWLLEYLELAYLTVYVVVPIGFGIVYVLVPARPVDAYWTVVLLAELACYAMLPWVQTRPPRTLALYPDIEHRSLRVRRLNARILRGGSIQANTIPSGHAAGACATALAAGTLVAEALLPLLVLAASIAIASVVGRYHYGIDSVFGILVGVGAWGVGAWGLGLGA